MTPRTTRAPLRRSLLLFSVVAVLLAVVEAALGARAAQEYAALVAAYPLVGAAFVVVGSEAWARRPSNATGALLGLTGVLVLAAALPDSNLPAPVVMLGVLLGEAPIAATLHVVLAFPSGRVRERWDQVLVFCLYFLLVLRQVPAALPGPDVEPMRDACSYLGAAVTIVATVRLWQRVGRERRGTSERWTLIAVYSYGMGLLLFIFFSARVLAPLLSLNLMTLVAIQVAAFAVLPLVFTIGILFGGFARTGELDELAAWLGNQVLDGSGLRDVLAEVLGDPSLRVWYRESPGDANGFSVVPVVAADGHDTGVTLSFDPTLFADPALVAQAGRVVAVALERERLRAQLIEEQEALRASRARVVEVGDRQRRELAQDLHDILQSRLTLTALQIGRLRTEATDDRTRVGLNDLGTDVDTLITEVRRLVHGVMPALLVERGLGLAVEDLVDRLPLSARLQVEGLADLPPTIATHAYFIVAEALTNAVRHASAATVRIEMGWDGDELRLLVADDGIGGAAPAKGAGLRGMADRVGALDGTLHITSPTGAGTRIEVVLPCGS